MFEFPLTTSVSAACEPQVAFGPTIFSPSCSNAPIRNDPYPGVKNWLLKTSFSFTSCAAAGNKNANAQKAPPKNASKRESRLVTSTDTSRQFIFFLRLSCLAAPDDRTHVYAKRFAGAKPFGS